MLGIWPENRQQAQLLRFLRDDGPCSRAELGDAVRLPRARVAAELGRLVQLGLVEAAGLALSRGGRRSSVVRIAQATRFLSVNIGAASLDVAITDGQLQVLARTAEATDLRRGPTAVIGQALEIANKLRSGCGGARFAGAGIGVPGPVSFRDGVPVNPPFMPRWHRFPVREMFSTELGCAAVIDNDVNVMALGEMHGGVARSFANFLFVKLGAGIGCGIVARGEVYRGSIGCAGDIGHTNVDDQGPLCVCGNLGCLEAFFSGAALTRDAIAAARSGDSGPLAARLAMAGTLTPLDVARAAATGDPVASGMIRDGARRVGQVLSGLVSFFNPGLMVIGGGLAGLGNALLAEIRGVVYRTSPPLATRDMRVVLSELAEQSGLIGAARLISDHVFAAAPVPRYALREQVDEQR